MYAIRDKVSGLYMVDRHRSFSTFQDMISAGLFFVTKDKAQKRIKEVRKILDDHDPSRGNYTRYVVYNDDGAVQYYSTSQAYAEAESQTGYSCLYRPLELEVAMLYVGEAKEVA
jgi:hypothetical protein